MFGNALGATRAVDPGLVPNQLTCIVVQWFLSSIKDIRVTCSTHTLSTFVVFFVFLFNDCKIYEITLVSYLFSAILNIISAASSFFLLFVFDDSLVSHEMLLSFKQSITMHRIPNNQNFKKWRIFKFPICWPDRSKSPRLPTGQRFSGA